MPLTQQVWRTVLLDSHTYTLCHHPSCIPLGALKDCPQSWLTYLQYLCQFRRLENSRHTALNTRLLAHRAFLENIQRNLHTLDACQFNRAALGSRRVNFRINSLAVQMCPSADRKVNAIYYKFTAARNQKWVPSSWHLWLRIKHKGCVFRKINASSMNTKILSKRKVHHQKRIGLSFSTSGSPWNCAA